MECENWGEETHTTSVRQKQREKSLGDLDINIVGIGPRKQFLIEKKI